MEKKGYSSKRELAAILRKGAAAGMIALTIVSGVPTTYAVAAVANNNAFVYPNCTTEPTDHSDMYINPTLENITAMYGVSYSEANSNVAIKGVTDFSQFKALTSGETVVVDPFSAVATSKYNSGREMWGYLLVFVKADTNYLFTNMESSGLGNIYSTTYPTNADGSADLSYYENLANYPNIQKLCDQAKAKGYTAVMGWTKWGVDTGNLNADINAKGQQGSLEMEAVAEDVSDVEVNDTITFDLTIKPGDIEGVSAEDMKTRVTADKPTIKTVKINNKIAKVYDYVEKEDEPGVYTAKVDYKVTKADIEAGTVTLAADSTVTYHCVLGVYAANITSDSTVPAKATKTVSIRPTQTAEAEGWTYDGTFHEELISVDSGYAGDYAGDPVYTYTDADGNPVEGQPTDAGTYTVTATWTLPNGTTVSASDDFEIAKRQVTLTSGSDSKAYDKTPLTVNSVTESGDGFLEADKPTYTVTGSQTEVGESENTFDYELPATSNKDNYDVTMVEGKLTVYKAVIATDTGDPKTTFTVEDPADVVYNGEDQAQKPVVKDPNGNVLEEGVDYVLEYPENVKDAGDITVVIKGIGNYEGEVESEYKILKRDVTVKSNDDSKVYDGTELKAEGAEAIEGEFVAGEEPTYTYTGSQTNVGKSENEFSFKFSDDVNGANYNVVLVNGTLEVTARPIVDDSEDPKANFIIEPPADTMYNGEEQPQKPVVKTPEGVVLVEGVDYVLEYPENVTDAGEVPVIIKGIGNYTDSVETSYEITPRSVTLSTDGDEKAYDGQPLTKDGVNESGDGFVEKDQPTYAVTGSQTEVGESENTLDIAYPDGFKESNYKITVETGILKVTPAEEKPGDEKPSVELVVTPPADTVYNGEEQPQKPVVKDPDGNILEEGKDYTLEYPDDTTNVGEKEVIVIPVDDPDNPVKVTYEITKRPVTLTSDGGEKEYDGEPLTNGTVNESGDGFVEKDRPSITVTGSQTEVGESENTFDYTFPEGVNPDNYDVTVETGMLKVTPAAEEPGDEKPSVELVVTPPADTEYNGEEQPQKPVVTDPEGNILEEGKDYTLEYPDDTTNVGEKEVIVVPVDDPENPITVTYEITKRPVSITSASAEKPYDGEALMAPSVTVGLDGFVAGEEPSYEFSGSQTEVGESENTFTFAFPVGVNPENYDVTYSNGILKVVPAETDPADENPGDENPGIQIVVTPPADTEYNGEDQPQKPVVTDPDGNPLEEGKDYILEYPDDTTNVGEKEVIVIPVGDPDNPVKVTYEITKRPVSITSDSAKKTYDGTPLMAEGVTVGLDGFVAGEEPGYAFTGSQTDVGISENGFTYTFPAGVDPDNYEITVKNGTLEVVKAQLVIEPPADVEYNGEPQPQKPVVKDPDGNILEEGKDYVLEYPDDVTNPGSKDVVVVPVGDNYEGGKTSYEITPKQEKQTPNIKAEKPEDVYYNGKPQEQKPVVTDEDGNILEEGKDYTLTYEGDTTNPGTVKVKITGIGDYEGKVAETYYDILPVTSGSTANEKPKTQTSSNGGASKTPAASGKTSTGKLAKTSDASVAAEALAATGGLGALLAAIGAKLRRRNDN